MELDFDKLSRSDYRRIVALEVSKSGEIELFQRVSGSEAVATEVIRVPFCGYFYLSQAELLSAEFASEVKIQPLETGAGELEFLLEVTDYELYLKLQNDFKKRKLLNGRDVRSLGDVSWQAQAVLPCVCFRDLEYADLKRLVIALECDSEDSGKIKRIAVADAQGKAELFEGDDEKELLSELLSYSLESDADIVEGYELFNVILPTLEKACKKHKLAFNLGRGGRSCVKRNSRFSAAERTINFSRYDLYGTQAVDTWVLGILFDISARVLEGDRLSDLAAGLGLLPEGAEVDGVIHELELVRSIDDILLKSYVAMARVLPVKLQDAVLRGNATLIDALLLPEYFRKRQRLPWSQAPEFFQGALTFAPSAGVFHEVRHVDVRSLYPSILLANEWAPQRDTLREFPRLLFELRKFRLQVKDAMRLASTERERQELAATQSSFKILINSFYGYLGCATAVFNDYKLAAQVTAEGRRILQSMLDFLSQNGATVIEADTDGIYFQEPAGCERDKFEKQLEAILPEGIAVEFDADYPAMAAYKSKNYALLDQDGVLHLTGAALKSRGMEPFLRDYIEKYLTSLLSGDEPAVRGQLLADCRQKLEEHAYPLSSLAKKELLNDSPENYQRKLSAGSGRRQASYELALRSGAKLKSGDAVIYYITGAKAKVSVVDNSALLPAEESAQTERNENVAWYLAKLTELDKRLNVLE